MNESVHDVDIDVGSVVHKKSHSMAQTFSIIVSGWPAVGKTTVAAELADEFALKIYNGGDILKEIATNMGYQTSGTDWWDSEEGRQFMEKRRSDPTSDKEVDSMLKEIVKCGNVVITSYTLPWLVKDNCIKLWLQGSPKNRAARMATRDKISYVEAAEIVRERDYQNKRIYEELYGFEFGKDLSVFDFSLNTDMVELSSLIQIAKDIVRKVKYLA
ncbi:MAG: cytidylate kinase family protein, partial [Anaerobacillus sp.]